MTGGASAGGGAGATGPTTQVLTIQQLTSSCSSILGHLTRIKNETNTIVGEAMTDDVDQRLESALNKLSVRWSNYEKAAIKVQHALDPDAADYGATQQRLLDEMEQHRDKTIDCKVAAERKRREWQQLKNTEAAERLARAAPPAQVTIPAVTVTLENPQSPPVRRVNKLKPPEPREFSGEILEWAPFWDVYERAVHNEDGYSAVEKMALLKKYLKGPALLTISALAVTTANYTVAIQLLKDQFGDKQTIIDAHMAKLDSLSCPKSVNEVSALRHFQLSIDLHMNALQAQGVAKESYGTLLATRLLRKIPEPLQKKWFENPENKSTSIDAFIKFLKENVAAVERFSRLKQLDDAAKPQQNKKESQQQDRLR